MSKTVQGVAIASICFVAGYLSADKSRELNQLRQRLAVLEESKESLTLQDPSTPFKFQRGETPERAPLPTEEEKVESQRLFMEKADRERRISSINKKWEDRASVYNKVFTELGLNETQSAEFQAKLKSVHLTATYAETFSSDLQAEKLQFKKELKEQIGEEAYKRFQDYEEKKHPRNDVSSFEEFLKSKNAGIHLTDDQKAMLSSTIKAIGATLSFSYDGPFDQLPTPISINEINHQEMVQKAESEIPLLAAKGEAVVQAAMEAGLPETTAQWLVEFYANKVAEKQQDVEFLRVPADVRAQMMIEEMERKDRERESLRKR